MSELVADENDDPKRAQGDLPADRPCLRCAQRFWSDGFGQRICKRCKSSPEWRSAMPESVGKGRRRPNGGSA